MNQILGDKKQATDRLLDGASGVKGYSSNLRKL